jgi:hypothetical protein
LARATSFIFFHVRFSVVYVFIFFYLQNNKKSVFDMLKRLRSNSSSNGSSSSSSRSGITNDEKQKEEEKGKELEEQMPAQKRRRKNSRKKTTTTTAHHSLLPVNNNDDDVIGENIIGENKPDTTTPAATILPSEHPTSDRMGASCSDAEDRSRSYALAKREAEQEQLLQLQQQQLRKQQQEREEEREQEHRKLLTIQEEQQLNQALVECNLIVLQQFVEDAASEKGMQWVLEKIAQNISIRASPEGTVVWQKAECRCVDHGLVSVLRFLCEKQLVDFGDNESIGRIVSSHYDLKLSVRIAMIRLYMHALLQTAAISTTCTNISNMSNGYGGVDVAQVLRFWLSIIVQGSFPEILDAALETVQEQLTLPLKLALMGDATLYYWRSAHCPNYSGVDTERVAGMIRSIHRHCPF